ncbi:MAG: hypothetical protein WKF89_05485 [Chitinophagaceae bacterium]
MKNKAIDANASPNNSERFGKVGEVKVKSLKEITGASAEDIRKAIEVIGFDRVKVEEYLINSRSHSNN